MELTENQHRRLTALSAFLQIFSERYKPRRMSIRCIEVFMRLATKPGMTYHEITHEMGADWDAAYTDVAQLGPTNTSGFEGLLLIEARRYGPEKRLTPTAKGIELYIDALVAWECAATDWKARAHWREVVDGREARTGGSLLVAGKSAPPPEMDAVQPLTNTLRYLCTELSPILGPSIFRILIAIAQDEGRGPTEYAKRLGISVSAVSRSLLVLTDYKTPRSKRRDFIVGERNPKNYRQSEYRLTRRGQRVTKGLLAALGE